MGASKAQRAATAERRNKAIKLRLAGAEWQAIADQLGYADKAAACKDVTRALERHLVAQRTSAETLRNLELDRLDRIQLGLWTAATSGDHKTADTVLRIMDRRARWAGFDVPPDLEDRIRQETTVRIAAQMATVWGHVLDGLGLSAEQAARVPGLLDAAIATFTAAAAPRRRAIEGVVDDEDEAGAA